VIVVPVAPGEACADCGGLMVVLARDGEVLFGRGADCSIRVGHDPEDVQVSRHAGTLQVLDDAVLVSNLSSSRPILMVPSSGWRRMIDPGDTVSSLPHRTFDIVLLGAVRQQYVIHVDATQLDPIITGRPRLSLVRPRGAS
jgi:hypothetical protein